VRNGIWTLAATLAALAGAVGPAAAAAPPRLASAKAAIVVDASDGALMFGKSEQQRRAIASTTKLMTALLALEHSRPSAVFTAPAYGGLPQESKIDLRRGERMRVGDLLEALLLESANDAAVTLAEGISGSRRAFVDAMNERARQLGLRDTSYANPIGLDAPGNYSTASDLARLAIRLLRNRRFARVVDSSEAVLESGARRRVVDNRNRLVARFRFVDGIKTGHTQQAGYLLVGAGHGRGGARVVTVVMGEPGESARDADTLALLRWGLSRFRSERRLDPRRPLARARVEHFGNERVALVPRHSLTVTARAGQSVRRRVRAPAKLEGPLPAGRRVGSVSVLRGGRQVGRVDLVTARAVPDAGLLRKLFSGATLPLLLLAFSAALAALVLGTLRLRVRLRLVRE
jgi:serine-type D-Ala-D-Ala carboxypeptidase (penicillin-binding protein 5/6)